jgi:hypothetical protein
MRAGLALLGLLLGGVSSSASSDPARATWPNALAALFAGVDRLQLDNTNLASHLSPAIVLGPAKCNTAKMPSAGSQAPVTNAVIAYGDDQACDTRTPVALLEFYIEATSAAPIIQLRTDLISRLQHPCFDGQLPTDPRRRAPARVETAWKLHGYMVTLVQEEGTPEAIAVAAFATALSPGPGVAAGYAKLRADYLAGLPASCR